jgi:hypothetical protein
MSLFRHINLYSRLDLGDQHHAVNYEAWRRIRAPIMLVGIAFCLLMVVASIAWGQIVGLVFALMFILLVGIAEVLSQWKGATETVIAEAIGREQVKRRLQSLRERGWQSAHRIRTQSGETIDHVVWGARGVFVIATRSDRGRVGIESGVLTLGGMMPPRNYIQDVHSAVAEVRDALSERLGKRVWVEGVVCMTRAFVNGYEINVSKPPTNVVHLERLLDFLETYENRRELSPEDVAAVGPVLDALSVTD